MTCHRIEPLLLSVIDGRATPEERERVDAHVAVCSGCARRLEEMRVTWSALDTLPAAQPDPWFDARVRARMREPLPKVGSHGRLHGGMRWAALAALVAMALWVWLRPPVQPPAPATNAQDQRDFAVIQNLPELENYDVISNFNALSALPGAQTVDGSQQVE